MKCREVKNLLVAYLDSEVTPSERILIKAHLAKCAFCRKELTALSTMQNRIRQSLQDNAAQATLSPQAWNRLQTRLAREACASQLWLQRLAQSVWRPGQRNPLAMKGEMKHKTILVPLVLVAFISVTFFTYTPMRALAQDILAQFKSVIITGVSTGVERDRIPTPIGQSTSTPMVIPLRILPVEEANQEAGFEVLYPIYISSGYQLIARGVHHSEAGVSVSTKYAMVGTTYDPTYGIEEGTLSIRLIQTRYTPDFMAEHPVGDAPTTEVTVREQPGLWVEQAAMGCCDEHGNVLLSNLLVWQEGDIFFDLRSDDLPLEEILRIAESLSP